VRVPKAKSWRKGQRPPSACLYAALDVADRTVLGEWHPTWNQHETWAFLHTLAAHYAAQGKRALVVLWDHAPWHVAAALRARVARYNRAAKRLEALRFLLVTLPLKAPWLMPLEAVFGQTKRAVGLPAHATVPDLQRAVERRWAARNHIIRSTAHGPTQQAA
jgi:transposase